MNVGRIVQVHTAVPVEPLRGGSRTPDQNRARGARHGTVGRRNHRPARRAPQTKLRSGGTKTQEDIQLTRAHAIRSARIKAKRQREDRLDDLDGESSTATTANQPWTGKSHKINSPPRARPDFSLGGGGGWASLSAPAHDLHRPPDSPQTLPLSTGISSAHSNATGKVVKQCSKSPKKTAQVPVTKGTRPTEKEESRYMTAEVRQALKRRRRHYSSGSMLLHQSLVKATNAFDLLASLSGPEFLNVSLFLFPSLCCYRCPRGWVTMHVCKFVGLSSHYPSPLPRRPAHTYSSDDTAGAR